jgi:hypothetical protein
MSVARVRGISPPMRPCESGAEGFEDMAETLAKLEYFVPRWREIGVVADDI